MLMPGTGLTNILFDFLTHPKFRVWRHALIIIVFSFISIGQSLFVFGDYMGDLGKNVYWFGISNTIVIVSFFYLNLYLLVPRLLLKNRYMEYLFALLGGTTVYLIIKGVIESYTLSHLGIWRDFTIVTLLDGLSNLTLYTICIASSSATILFRQWISDTEKINDLENNRLKKSVDEIKSLINTRLLSNVLNYASEEVKTEPDKVSDILFRLSEVLRYELYDCKREKVLLSSDIGFINQYLSLEQLNCRNNFSYAISPAKKIDLFVPPFLFMPLIKRIIEREPADMQLAFETNDNVVKFSCEVLGTDLTTCDFSKEEQRFSAYYQNNIKIEKNSESVKLWLYIG